MGGEGKIHQFNNLNNKYDSINQLKQHNVSITITTYHLKQISLVPDFL